ncbi:DNA polymerase III subunit delta' [Roseovarius sp. TE539]|uniref:DNA polymerase III subunit delta' n=1 Tax=Roseovarius sp. TE539 TaxID=2249812 RepID=UPI000DDEF1C3|nr:DNA polymerase III subunit delta' [Roseovarius sp. TE539]RBI69073.1 DNA polymerase III subunit delta' [Roseovarius sp. TE539]
MSDLRDLPEPDRAEGAPHPRQTPVLFGQGHAEADFLTAFNGGRHHHAWLLTGPHGVGKATLAWRIARFLLAAPPPGEGGGLFGDAPPAPDTLSVDPEIPVARRMAAGADPGLFVLRRGPTEKGDRLASEILVGEVRKLMEFLHLSAADGGRRVVIVDCADEMNRSAANALLKMLEEPPPGVTFLMVSHRPARLLPTIRSRCRELRLRPLGAEDMTAALRQAEMQFPAESYALTELAGGSVGAAVGLINLDGLALYREIVALFSGLPDVDRTRALKLADAVAARDAGNRFDLLFELTDLMLARLARRAATGMTPTVEAAPGEAEMLARLGTDPRRARLWAACAQEVGNRARRARAVNLDPAALVLDTVGRIKQAAVE